MTKSTNLAIFLVPWTHRDVFGSSLSALRINQSHYGLSHKPKNPTHGNVYNIIVYSTIDKLSQNPKPQILVIFLHALARLAISDSYRTKKLRIAAFLGEFF